ncbi:MAG: UDP-2,3-diacylglucosamine diphosphatase [Bacteroidales bacterium]|nr:UDP-2,3-diacylglucosamine diphosphatase [Bacteroidales bacterium]
MQEITGTVYFMSDCHFGYPNQEISAERERRVVAFLDSIAPEVTHLFLLGDIFDYWFEYKYVVPKHHVRFLGRLAALADKGVKIYYILGNHDMWNFGYLADEIGLQELRGVHDYVINGKKVRLGHGDGLDPKDKGYLLIKWIYNAKFNQKWFSALHPRIATAIANRVSHKSRMSHQRQDESCAVQLNEPVLNYCKNVLKTECFDYFIFGHQHHPFDIALNDNCRYINTGDWQTHDTYAVMRAGNCELKYFKTE